MSYYYNNTYGGGNRFAQDTLAVGNAAAMGISSYYLGKAQSSLAQKDPQAYYKLRKSENKMGLIFGIIFIAIFVIVVVVMIVVGVKSSKDNYEEEKTTES